MRSAEVTAVTGESLQRHLFFSDCGRYCTFTTIPNRRVFTSSTWTQSLARRMMLNLIFVVETLSATSKLKERREYRVTDITQWLIPLAELRSQMTLG